MKIEELCDRLEDSGFKRQETPYSMTLFTDGDCQLTVWHRTGELFIAAPMILNTTVKISAILFISPEPYGELGYLEITTPSTNLRINWKRMKEND